MKALFKSAVQLIGLTASFGSAQAPIFFSLWPNIKLGLQFNVSDIFVDKLGTDNFFALNYHSENTYHQ